MFGRDWLGVGIAYTEQEFRITEARRYTSGPLLLQHCWNIASTALADTLGKGILTQDIEVLRLQHVRLVEAIQTRDSDQARQAVRGHCVRPMELQLSQMTADGFDN